MLNYSFFCKINESVDNNIYYHSSASGDFRGGTLGFHMGTYQAAKEALQATIGIPVEGEWDGTRIYGETLLSGRNTLLKKDPRGYLITGYNCAIPDDDFYPSNKIKRATYSNREEIPLTIKPKIYKVRIIGNMTNTPNNPYSDIKANSMMKGLLKRGVAKSGFYYINDGEDAGSISAVVPNGKFVEIL